MNSLYDIYLGDKSSLRPYRVASLVRDSAPSISPRFSTGQQGETDLDLLKSASVENVGGGMFQRDFDDTSMVARAIGIYNAYDANLYPTMPRSSATSMSPGYYPSTKAESATTSFVTFASFSAGTYYNLLSKMTYSATYASVTLPAALQNNGFSNITGSCLHKGYLFLASMSLSFGANTHRYDPTFNTWQDIGSNFVSVFTIRDNLYGIQTNSSVWSITNELAAGAASATQITIAGSQDFSDCCAQPVEFNGAAYIPKPSGIYRFDGVSAIKVLSLYTREMKVFNGALYFVSGFWLYRFDGVNLVRLQFFGSTEILGSTTSTASLGLSANSDYLFISTVSLTSSYSQGDKFGASASALRRLYTYDGAAFLMLNESADTVGASFSSCLVTILDTVYDYFATIPVGSWALDRYSFAISTAFTTAAVTTASRLEITTSEFDDRFPNIFKSLEAIELLYSGMIAGDAIAINYQLFDGKTWGSWVNLANLSSTSDNYVEITDFSKKLFKRMKINIVATLAAGSTLSIKAPSWRYTLQPRTRWRWQTEILAEGNSALTDLAGSLITTDSNELVNYVNQSIKQKTPSFMLGPDYGIVKTTVNSSALSFIIKGQVPMYTDPYSEYQLCAVKNASGVWEIMRVASVSYASGPDESTITVKERGYIGITAASLNANAEFHLAYRVYINRLLRDSVLLNKNNYSEQASGESQLKRHLTIEIIEV
jgi:hypothetical protein